MNGLALIISLLVAINTNQQRAPECSTVEARNSGQISLKPYPTGLNKEGPRVFFCCYKGKGMLDYSLRHANSEAGHSWNV